ncbi:MAG: hypothetical protein GW859_08170 [Sphingomonadales bacterium]|nr:hypothetical protein [Sphingomonadales bacterium]
MRTFVSLIAIAAATAAVPAIAQDAATAPATPNPIEVEARLAAAFAKYDAGAKGFLTEAEFHTMMAEEQGGADEAKSKAVYAAADGDANAELSLDEFIGFVKAQLAARAQPRGEAGAGPRGGQRMVAQLDEMWKKYDSGAKGWLSADEYVAMMAEVGAKARAMQAEMGRGEGRGQWSEEGAEKRARDGFAEADANHDGQLTQEELKAQFAVRMDRMRQRRAASGGEEMQGPGDD